MVEIVRRRFLQGLIGLVAAPAIVRVASLMPVSVWEPKSRWIPRPDIDEVIALLREQNEIFDVLCFKQNPLTTPTPIPYEVWRKLNEGSPHGRASSVAFPPKHADPVCLGQYLTWLPKDVC